MRFGVIHVFVLVMRRCVLSKGELVLYDGFSQYPELIPGNVYCIDDSNSSEIKLYNNKTWYDKILFSSYHPGDCFQHYDKSEGLWTIKGLENQWIRLRRLNWMREGRRKDIDITDIQWYNYDKNTHMYCECCNGERVIQSDISYPGIVLDGTITYSGRRYRSMDGSHRIQKLLHYGYKTVPVYVFHINEIRNYFEPMEE